MNFWVNTAFWPAGMVSSKSILVVCESSSYDSLGEELMVLPPTVIVVSWMSSSKVFNEMLLVSSTTSSSMETVPSYLKVSKLGSRVRS
jgi:hypothetical protein